MAIAPVSSVNTNAYTLTKPEDKSQKVTNPITEQKTTPAFATENGALKSYFLGGQAVSFGFGVSTGGFVTKQMDDVPCCCCGGRMVLANQLDNKAREFAGINGEALADKIEADKDFFRTPQRVVMMLAAEEARKHPGYDLARAKKAAGNNLKGKTEEYCINSLKGADAIVKATYGEENPVSKLIASEIENLSEGKIARMPFTEKLVKIQEQIDPVTYHAVLDAAMDIPASFKDVTDAYGQAKGDAKNVAKSLLKPSTQTIEHIHPKSHGGPNATENFIAECKDCNNPRGNMSYSQWLKVHPEYPHKAQEHVEWFQQQIVDGNISSKYDSWGVDVKKTLSKESNGIIELKVLNADKIQELRDAKKAGKEVSVSQEIEKLYGEEKAEEEAAA